MEQVRESLSNERSKRGENAHSFENLLQNILNQIGVKKQHFHGGSMNGVCCKRLLDNVVTIFNKIREIIDQKIANEERKMANRS